MDTGDCIKGRVLIVDDELNMRIVLKAAFEDEGYETMTASRGSEALDSLAEFDCDLMILDLKLPDMTGIEVFRRAIEMRPGIVVIMVTAYSSVDTAIEAMKMGAYDYITKPFNVEKLLMVAGNAIEGKHRCAATGYGNRAGHPEGVWSFSGVDAALDEEFGGVVGNTLQMRQVVEMAQEIAPTNATVLIYGESGTGKELLAEFIHRKSLRVGKPFVKVNCAAIPETLLESELFGHEKGAFTHAISRRLGRFELAHTGTVFLDEVGEMSPAMQAKLLRVLQEKEFERVGGTETIKVDVRLIAATNKNLRQAIADGTFREDLYYRLSVVPLYLPALRERKQDIPTLASQFVQKYNSEFGRSVKGLTREAMDMLMDYDWHGNIRELENAVERAVLLSRGEYLASQCFCLGMNPGEALGGKMHTAVQLDDGHSQEENPGVVGDRSGSDCHMRMRHGGGADAEDGGEPADVLSLEELELRHIRAVLEHTGDNRTEAARLLGINRRTLLNKIKKYGL